MEFKYLYNMFWLLFFLSFICFHTPAAYGNRQDAINKQPDDSRNFPFDLMTASASAAVQKSNSPKMKLDDDRKTLSQQVADGKYGLIQKELFAKPISRPGVLSYDTNGEVPKDNVNNLGGLNKSDIWLAENHLLVLKGGVFPLIESLPEYSKPAWPPIDDFDAPRRQVKLPKHPKVPPPFPVQLTDGGPLQILGTNFTRTINDTFFAPPYAVPPMEGYDPGNGSFFPPASAPPYPYPTNATTGETPFPAPPYPTPLEGDKTRDGPPPAQFPFSINGGLPPFFDSLPPGSAILPPPNNQTDQFDEDDLSIYYPPPYSFYYPKDNSTEVPPGPLVPGIVLPPPPDFFGPLAKFSSTTTVKSTSTTMKPTYSTTTPSLPTIKTRKPEISKTKPTTTRIKPIYHTTTLPAFIPTGFTDKKQHPNRNKTISVTILRPIKPPTRKPPIYIYDNNVSGKPFAEYGPPPSPTRHHQQNKITITTTKVPLRAFFTSSEIEKNLVTHIPEREQQHTTKSAIFRNRPKPATQIYYYDNTPLTNSISTPYPIRTNQLVNQTKNYYNAQVKPKYYYLPSGQRPQNKIVQQTISPNHFKKHIIKLQEHIESYQNPPKQYEQTVYKIQTANQEIPATKPIFQQNLFGFQRNNNQRIPSTNPIYQQDVIIPTPRPIYSQNIFQIQNDHQEIQSPKPVYQYSFEVANYKEQHDKLQIPTVPEQTPQGRLRNLPKYTVQIEPAVEITTERPTVYYQDDFIPQRASRQKYYNNNVPAYNNYPEQASITPHPTQEQTYTVTPNPVYQMYYTKQDEQYFDDITKKYFTTFGKKLPTSTTPIPSIVAPTDQRQVVYSQQVQENGRNRQNYFSSSPLRGDVVVNYVNEAPTHNLQSDYLHLRQQHQPPQQSYPQVSKQVPQQFAQAFHINENYQQSDNNNNNYRKKILPKNNIQAIQAVRIPSHGEGKPGSFISYELPGDDGAHFYFLTPQLTQKDDRSGTPEVSYYYSPAQSSSRIRRNS